MTETFNVVLKTGWRAAEAGLLIVVLCVLLNIILGPDSGQFVASVAANANVFMLGLPAGTVLGLALIVLAYAAFKTMRVKA